MPLSFTRQQESVAEQLAERFGSVALDRHPLGGGMAEIRCYDHEPTAEAPPALVTYVTEDGAWTGPQSPTQTDLRAYDDRSIDDACGYVLRLVSLADPEIPQLDVAHVRGGSTRYGLALEHKNAILRDLGRAEWYVIVDTLYGDGARGRG